MAASRLMKSQDRGRDRHRAQLRSRLA